MQGQKGADPFRTDLLSKPEERPDDKTGVSQVIRVIERALTEKAEEVLRLDREEAQPAQHTPHPGM